MSTGDEQPLRAATRGLRVRLVASLMLLALASAGAFGVAASRNDARRADASVVNVSGRQRMLSQRVASYASELRAATGARRMTAQAALAQAAGQMRRAQRGLLQGDADLGLPRERSHTVLRLYERPPAAVSAHLSRFVTAAERLAAAADPDPADVALLQSEADGPLLAGLEQVVAAQQRASQRGTAGLAHAQRWILGISLGLLVVLALSVFRPLLRRMEREVALMEVLQEVTETANQADTMQQALQVALRRLGETCGWPVGHVYRREGDSLVAAHVWSGEDRPALSAFVAASERLRFAAGVGLPGRVLASGRPLWIRDLAGDPSLPRARVAAEAGLRTGMAFPVLVRDEVVAVVELFSDRRRSEDAAMLEVLRHVGTQVGRVAERERAEVALAHQASHDVLTGLPNRTLLGDRLAMAQARQRRQGGGIAVLLVDLDRFKPVNDTLGHAAGDELLRQVAQRLDAVVRAGDTLAHLGGDEFVLLCEGLEDSQAAVVVAERVVEHLRDPFAVAGHQLTMQASIGISCRTDPDQARDLLREADAAAHQAKATGTCRWALHDPRAATGSAALLLIERELPGALARGELSLVYQPIVEVGGASAVGAEALLRWEHPELGAVGPDVFVPVAETSGLIDEIGRWVIEEACAQTARWPARADGRCLQLNVNLSARQLEDTGLQAHVHECLRHHGLPAGQLGLELTETVLARLDAAAIAQLDGLRALGVRIALDDFGTGYSTLSHLLHLRVDEVKIDRSFMASLGGTGEEALLQAIDELAGVLGLAVVAEGVEHREQHAVLRGLGVAQAQGYLFSRPLGAEAIAELFMERRPSLLATEPSPG